MYACDRRRESGSPSGLDIVVRAYAPGDYAACRSLWVELTEQHRRIYQDRSIGRDDPGSGIRLVLGSTRASGLLGR
jgi:hypothetical protein